MLEVRELLAAVLRVDVSLSAGPKLSASTVTNVAMQERAEQTIGHRHGFLMTTER